MVRKSSSRESGADRFPIPPFRGRTSRPSYDPNTVKLTVLWILSGAWCVVLGYVAWTYFKQGVSPETGFLERPKPFFTGIGALTVGCVPLFLTWLLHRYQKKRLRGRLLRERERIQRQLTRLDEREGAPAEPASSSS